MKKLLVIVFVSMLILSGCVLKDSDNTVYTSKLYGFEFTYPSDYKIWPVGMENLSDGNEQFGVSVSSNAPYDEIFSISIEFTPTFTTLPPVDEEVVGPLFEAKNIYGIANMAYGINKQYNQSNIVSGLEEIDVGGQTGYQFVLKGSESFGFAEETGGRILGAERIIYVSDGVNLYRISLFSDNPIAEEILGSLHFLVQ